MAKESSKRLRRICQSDGKRTRRESMEDMILRAVERVGEGGRDRRVGLSFREDDERSAREEGTQGQGKCILVKAEHKELGGGD